MESRNPPKGDLAPLTRASSPSIPSRNAPSIRVHAPQIVLPKANKTPAIIIKVRLVSVSMFAVMPRRARNDKKGFNTFPYHLRTHLETILVFLYYPGVIR